MFLCRFAIGTDAPWAIPPAHNLTVNCQGAAFLFAGSNPAIRIGANSGLTLNDCLVISTTVFTPPDGLQAFGVVELTGFAADTGALMTVQGGSFQAACSVCVCTHAFDFEFAFEFAHVQEHMFSQSSCFYLGVPQYIHLYIKWSRNAVEM